MRRIDHPLLPYSLGSQRTLTSFHYGERSTDGTKVYIQASLHAEELPGMLTAHHLRPMLQAAEDAGLFCGEVILVPVSNPIGLAQRLDHKPMGRFELDSSENFNRHYPDLASAVMEQVASRMGPDGQANVQIVRQAIGEYLQQWRPKNEIQSLRRTLLRLAFDADVVLDLHCDCEGVVHFYCEEPCWPTLEPIARFIGAQAILLARDSGGGPIDECLSGVWWRLKEKLAARGVTSPIPQGCCSTTIELRGELDVTHALARKDASAIFDYLQHIGVIKAAIPPAAPELLCAPTPLAGSETLRTPVPGVLTFAARPGQMLKAGDLVAEVIDPIEATVERICATVDGCFYAHIADRYVTAGCEIGKVAGANAFRTGQLLGD